MQALSRTLRDQLWIKLRSAFLRVTLTRVTAAFFVFSLVYCFGQGIIQAFLYTVDSERSVFISTILQDAQVSQDRFAWLTGTNQNYQLYLCTDIPLNLAKSPCWLVFPSGLSNSNAPRRSFDEAPLSIFPREVLLSEGLQVGASHDASGAINGVDVSFNNGVTILHLNNTCTSTLVYAGQVLKNFMREDCTLVSVQFWLFAISFFAIMYESIPHLLAVFCARVLLTAWSAYTIWRTLFIEGTFLQLITDPNTPCHADLFPKYFTSRTAFEIPDLVLNCTALVFSGALSWRLLRTYGTRSFKSLGAPTEIIRIYKYFMAVLACLQLSVFILVTAMALWINQLMIFAWMSLHTPIYEAGFIFTTIFLIPWITMGWYGIRCENERLMRSFLILGFIFVAGWAIMFYSLLYRWTFLQWPFFAGLMTTSFVVVIASMVLSTKCWLNFNKGLANYLYAEDALASSDFEPEVFPLDAEKYHIGGLAAYLEPDRTSNN